MWRKKIKIDMEDQNQRLIMMGIDGLMQNGEHPSDIGELVKRITTQIFVESVKGTDQGKEDAQ